MCVCVVRLCVRSLCVRVPSSGIDSSTSLLAERAEEGAECAEVCTERSLLCDGDSGAEPGGTDGEVDSTFDVSRCSAGGGWEISMLAVFISESASCEAGAGPSAGGGATAAGGGAAFLGDGGAFFGEWPRPDRAAPADGEAFGTAMSRASVEERNGASCLGIKDPLDFPMLRKPSLRRSPSASFGASLAGSGAGGSLTGGGAGALGPLLNDSRLKKPDRRLSSRLGGGSDMGHQRGAQRRAGEGE